MAPFYQFMKEGGSNEPDSAASLWANLKSVTSAHGVPHISRSRGPIKNGFWWVIFLACSSGLVYNVYMITRQYFRFGISISLSHLHVNQLEFPAVTICNNCPLKNSQWKEYKSLTSDTSSLSDTAVNRRKRATANCPFGWREYGSHCYYASVTSTSWNGSQTTCKSLEPGADLVSFTDQTEFNYLKSISTAYTANAYHIGVKRSLVWLQDTSTYSNFDSGQPDYSGDCVVVDKTTIWYSSTTNWRSSSCSDSHQYICKKDKGSLCGSGWSESGSFCFYHSSSSLTWDDAKSACESSGSYLATILDSSEESAISGSMSQSFDYWIGLRRQWEFTDGTPVLTDDSFMWSSASSSGEYGTLTADGVVTETGSDSHQFICQLPITGIIYVIPESSICPFGWAEYGSHCYFVSTASASWSGGQTTCQSLEPGGDLVSFADQAEFDYIKSISTAVTSNTYHIGLEEKFSWLQDTSTYSNFDSGQPDNSGDCVVVDKTSDWISPGTTWKASSCSDSHRYICKKDPISPWWCGSGWSLSGDHCFYYSSSSLTWNDAKSACESSGSYLATILSGSEESAISGSMSQSYDNWIGLRRQWEFTDGTPVITDDSFMWSSASSSGEYGTLTADGVVAETGSDSQQFICKLPMTGITYVATETTCPYGWIHHGDFCYYVSVGPASWPTARHNCQTLDDSADLVSFSDQAEFDYVQSITTDINPSYYYQVGVELGFSWVDGTSTYTNWKNGQPDGVMECVVLYVYTSYSSYYLSRDWYDRACTDTNKYICKKRKVGYTCDYGWSYVGISYCFYESTDTATWDDAVTSCQSMGAQLATILDNGEEGGVSEGTYWIGLHQTWRYTDGTPESDNIAMWEPNEPSGSPSGVLGNSGVSQTSGSEEFPYVCKMMAANSTMSAPTTAVPTTSAPTTAVPTTSVPTTAVPTTSAPTTAVPTTSAPTTAVPTTSAPTTAVPTTSAPTTAVPTTTAGTTAGLTTTVDTTTTPQPITNKTEDVFKAINLAINNQASFVDSVQAEPVAVEGSIYPERTETRQDFQEEEEIIKAIASLPQQEKASLGTTSQDMILDCQYDGYNCYLRDFAQFENPVHGNCYTFNSGRNATEGTRLSYKTGKRHGLHLVLNIDQDDYVTRPGEVAGVRIVAHNQEDVPFPEDEGITISPGMATFIGLQRSEKLRLSNPYGQCVNNDQFNKDRNVFEEQDSSFKYTVKACANTCLQRNIIATCGCASSHFPKTGQGVNNSNEALPFCDTANVAHSDCLYGVTHSFEQNELTCDCPRLCHEKTYKTYVSSGLWPSDVTAIDTLTRYATKVGDLFEDETDRNKYRRNLMKVVVYYEEFHYTVSEEKPAYRRSNYLSDLGGSIGLWIGMSLFTLFEYIEFVMDVLVLFCSKICKSGTKVSDVNKKSTKTTDPENPQKPSVPISPPPPYSPGFNTTDYSFFRGLDGPQRTTKSHAGRVKSRVRNSTAWSNTPVQQDDAKSMTPKYNQSSSQSTTRSQGVNKSKTNHGGVPPSVRSSDTVLQHSPEW